MPPATLDSDRGTPRPLPGRRKFGRLLATCLLLGSGLVGKAAAESAAPTPLPEKIDVVVYGATPAGIAAAIEAARLEANVLLVEPTVRIGGLTTNGLSHTDFRTFEGLTGHFHEFRKRVRRHYAETYGEDSPQVKDCWDGTQAEPGVNLLVYKAMLAEQPKIRVVVQRRLTAATAGPARTNWGKIVTSATFVDPQGAAATVQARVFIDASYEGDLAAAAGAPFRLGRESKSEYGEPDAPEVADDAVMGCNFRLILTQVPENRVPVPKPEGYDRNDYLTILPWLREGKLKSVFVPQTGGVYKAHLPPLPNGKHDINDVSNGLVRLSLPNLAPKWCPADDAGRKALFAAHVRHNVGLLHFLQNDEEVPEKYRNEARTWGLCKDEFTENGHLPVQLYVREGRRIVGEAVFTERDVEHAPGDARGVFKPGAIAIGDYGPNSHGTGHEGPTFGGKHFGEFYRKCPPYQLPFDILVPKGYDNLLVPTACSASHCGYCAVRLEPIWSSLGQAAGAAAGMSVDLHAPAARIPIGTLRKHLHARGAATIYVSDVPPEAVEFRAVQWWGSLGGLHGLEPAPAEPGTRGKPIKSQYFEAFPGHAAQLDRPLDAPLRTRWTALAVANGISADALTGAATRGDFLKAAFAESEKPIKPPAKP